MIFITFQAVQTPLPARHNNTDNESEQEVCDDHKDG